MAGVCEDRLLRLLRSVDSRLPSRSAIERKSAQDCFVAVGSSQ
jgi:hypothetical protein